MGTDNFALGAYSFPDVPFVGVGGAGLKTPFGLWLPPVTRIAAYVRSTGPDLNADPPEIQARLFTTLAAALKQCRSGKGDTIIVLPGHSESVSTATMMANLVAGTRIIGLGSPRQDDAPTFRWTATTSQWAIAVKNVVIAGLRLRLEGANGVVKAINITAAGCTLIGNYIQLASGASNKATIGIEVGSAATDCQILDNFVVGTATHNVTDGILAAGATVPSGLTICRNRMIASATAANGLVRISVAALNLLIEDNAIYNTHTASTSCITVGNVAADGVIRNNHLATINDGTVTAQGLVLGAAALVRCFNNQSCDEPIKSGVLTPAAAT